MAVLHPNVLRIATIGALFLSGSEFCKRYTNIKPIVTTKKDDDLFIATFDLLGLEFDFMFHLDLEDFRYIEIEYPHNGKVETINVNIPYDCDEEDQSIVLTRLIEHCFTQISICYKKLDQ